MAMAMEKYKVDCVIGNILNNKEYVRIIDKEGKVDEYHSNIEQNIVLYLIAELGKFSWDVDDEFWNCYVKMDLISIF